jgi:hypothetical protein
MREAENLPRVPREAILDPRYWARRLREAKRVGRLHEAVFRCPTERWLEIESKHREILARTVGDGDSILDCGCGWGRLLTLLPKSWIGRYVGVDISPDFLDMKWEAMNAAAGQAYWRREAWSFERHDLDRLPPQWPAGWFDWGVLVSIRPMMKRNLGDEAWAKMEAEVRRVCKRLLYLEYDPQDEGSVE